MLSLADRQVALRDSELPGLSLLLDVQAFREALLLSGFQMGPNDHWEIRYVRYKPKRRCIVVYEDTHRNTIVATARTMEGWKKQENIAPSSCNQSVDGENNFGHSLWRSVCVSIDQFPRDRQLRSVAKLLDPSKKGKVLRRVLGDERLTQGMTLKTLAYKPARRYVACGTIDDVPKCTLKFYTSAGFRSALRRVEALEEIGWPMANVIGKSERYGCLATEWVAGETLTEVARRSDSSIGLFEEVGRSLAALHSLGSRNLSIDLPAEELPNYTELALDLGHLAPMLLDRVRELASELQRSLLTLSVEPTIIHGDCYAKQVIVEEGKVRWIDWDQVSIGDPYRDLGNFVAQLHWEAERGESNAERIGSLEKAFLEGYVSIAGPIDWKRYYFQLSGALLACSFHPFRRALEDWPTAMARMVERAESAMKSAFDEVESTKTHPSKVGNRNSKNGVVQECDGLKIEEMTAIESMLDCRLAEERLKRDCPEIASKFGEYQVESARVTRHKPGRRCMIEYRLQPTLETTRWSLDSSPTFSVLGKVRFRGLKDRHWQVQQRLREELDRLDSSVSVPRVLGSCPGWSMWLQERIDGQPITADKVTSIETHGRIAQALTRLHKCTVPEVAGKHSIEEELQLLRERIMETRGRHPSWASAFERVLLSCEEIAEGMEAYSDRLIHRDFYFDQVLKGSDRLYLLDLDLVCRGPAALDVGNYAAHLIEYGVRFPELKQHCFEAAMTFCDAYRLTASEVSVDEIRRWAWLALARLIVMSVDFPGRAHTTHDLLDLFLGS